MSKNKNHQSGPDASPGDVNDGQAPGVDTPAVDTPAVDTPAVDTPAVDTPAVDTPAVATKRDWELNAKSYDVKSPKTGKMITVVPGVLDNDPELLSWMIAKHRECFKAVPVTE